MSLTSAPAAGAKLRASVLSALVAEAAGVTKMRTTDGTAVNNSTTLVADSVLTFAVEASSTYAIDGWLVTNSNTTADIKFSSNAPTGATGRWSIIGAPTTETSTIPGSIDMGVAGSITGTHTRAGTANDFCFIVKGQLVTDTAGTWVLTMAQNTANASDTKIIAGSWITLRKVA